MGINGWTWACPCNVGANSPSGYGSYFAWGEISACDQCSMYNYKYEEDDVAQSVWGGAWRMPTKGELEELLNKCSWKKELLNGVSGYRVSRNGNSIFLPLSGCRNEQGLDGRGKNGEYWSKTPYNEERAYILFLQSNGSKEVLHPYRYLGRSVRPVVR